MPIKNSYNLEKLRKEYREGKLEDLDHKKACVLVSCKPGRIDLTEVIHKYNMKYPKDRLDYDKALIVYKKLETFLFKQNYGTFSIKMKLKITLYLTAKLTNKYITWKRIFKIIYNKRKSWIPGSLYRSFCKWLSGKKYYHYLDIRNKLFEIEEHKIEEVFRCKFCNRLFKNINHVPKRFLGNSSLIDTCSTCYYNKSRKRG